MEGKPQSPQDWSDDADHVTLAIFPVIQYLGDPALQKAVAELAKSWDEPPNTQALRFFHPLSMEEYRQKRDSDVYFLFTTRGKLVRTHAVVRPVRARCGLTKSRSLPICNCWKIRVGCRFPKPVL